MPVYHVPSYFPFGFAQRKYVLYDSITNFKKFDIEVAISDPKNLRVLIFIEIINIFFEFFFHHIGFDDSDFSKSKSRFVTSDPKRYHFFEFTF